MPTADKRFEDVQSDLDSMQQALNTMGARLDELENRLSVFERDVRESVTIRSRDG